MYIRLNSYRARRRVDTCLGRTLPWLCPWRRGQHAACAPIGVEEWAQVKDIPGVARCTTCVPLGTAQEVTTTPPPPGMEP